ncbi:MAG: TetR/AcrR family transcriptional regulator [Nocardioides sp.]
MARTATPAGDPDAPVDTRRDQMLDAAAELIAERGLSRTRIADVAARVGTSPALVMYYFATKDELLIEALRHSEAGFYQAAEELLDRPATLGERLATLVDLTITVESQGEVRGHWGLWFDLWAEAFRHPEVARDRRALDEQWRDLVRRVVEAGINSGEIGEIDVQTFAVTWTALLDGLAVQVALHDEVVTPERARDIALDFAAGALGLA